MVVRGLDKSSNLRLYAQHFEIIAGDRISIDTFRRVTPAQTRISKAIKGGDPAEGGVSPPIIFKHRIRRGQLFSVRPRSEAKLVEILRIAHIERVQQDRVQYSENNDVRANSQHQRD